jgi:hypothetical protein
MSSLRSPSRAQQFLFFFVSVLAFWTFTLYKLSWFSEKLQFFVQIVRIVPLLIGSSLYGSP